MAAVTDIVFYPVKSCAGIAVREATLTRFGLAVDNVYDREWMLVDEDGLCLTQREHPRMALVTPRLHTETLELRAPGMLPLELQLGLPHPDDTVLRHVRIWDDEVDAYDCGDLAAAWCTNAVGIGCRLVRFHPEARRLASTKWTGAVEAPTMFSDAFPFLVVGAASLEDLNGKLQAAGRAALPMNRFRPNIVVSGTEAFDEDYTASFTCGPVVLKPVKPCARCPMPSVDQATGQFGPDPLDILRSYRVKPQVEDGICFGMNAILVSGEGERLRIGQAFEVELSF